VSDLLQQRQLDNAWLKTTELENQLDAANAEIKRLRDAIKLVLEADALRSHAFEEGDDDTSIYMLLKNLSLTKEG